MPRENGNKRALNLSEEVEQGAAALEDILDRVGEKFQNDRTVKKGQQRKVFDFGDHLLDLARQRLDTIKNRLVLRSWRCTRVAATRPIPIPPLLSLKPRAFSAIRWGRTAADLDYYVNLNDYRGWAQLLIVTETQFEILFAFHGIGREFTGVLVCAGMAYAKQKTEDGAEFVEMISLSKEPFYFAYDEPLTQIHDRFDKWLDDAIIVGLDHWRKIIGA